MKKYKGILRYYPRYGVEACQRQEQKYFFLLLFSVAAYFSLTANTTHAPVPVSGEEPVILMTVTHTDGEVVEYVVTLDELFSSDCDFEEVFKCTYRFSDSSCTRTRGTCNEAAIAFAECACKDGHTLWC